MACCHHVCTTVSSLVIHFTLNFLKEAMGAALPRQSQTLLLSKPTFKCLLLPMLRRPNTFCYETCFWFIHCFFSRALNTCIVCRRTWTLCIAKTPWLQKCLFFFFSISLSKIHSFGGGNGHLLPALLAIMWEAAKIPIEQIWVNVLEESPQISSSFCHCSAPEQLKIFIIFNSNQSPRL